ncbi:MAG TPA: guanine deaminase [Burkholderiales bacterium]|nr:guanine deaminase [Burkholderiales bacterium]
MTTLKPALAAFRGMVLHFLTDPGEGDDPHAFQFFEDGLLVLEQGRVRSVGPARDLLTSLPAGASVTDYSGRLLLPGFVDVHIHYPQIDVIASYGTRLLDWLERYTFPAEARFSDAAHARDAADFFLDELLRNGTTTALVLGSVHPVSVEVFFERCLTRNLRMVAGKVLMDRNCPRSLRDTAESGYRESAQLIERWHGRERLGYAITPRFAGTSSEAQLQLAGQLAREHPDVHIHSHMSETAEEIAWVRQLYPWSASYLDVYDRFGLLRERAVYAHCIHLDAQERSRFARTGAAAAACPTSNLFLGSGLFDFDASLAAGMCVGIGTDVGGGTSFSMLRTLSEAYKVAQLKQQRLSPWRAFYLATLGGARALKLEREIGNFEPGKEGDFVVLRLDPTPLLERRMRTADTLAEKLFALMTLGDDRAVAATYVLGEPAYAAGTAFLHSAPRA